MALLFEYGKWEAVCDQNVLKQFLIDIWKQRSFNDSQLELNEEESDYRYQPFLRFDNNQIRANNFVGFIQNGKEVIEIYPKVFRDHCPHPSREEKLLMLRHIFYWFDYCRRWRFPFNQASLDFNEIEQFPELIINLIANQFLETVSNQPLTMYQHLEEALVKPKGTINFKRYINNSLAHGNFHQIECDYEPFLFDNKVNRIIKYCTRLLMNQTKLPENMRLLQEVVFILDEVEDLPCTIRDVEMLSFNSFFEEYSILMNSCRLILNQHLYSNNDYDFSQWCLLFPMENIFEDFLAGFIEKYFSNRWKVEYQKSNEYLSNNPKVFNLQHDIFLTSKENRNHKIIIDTKYKLRPENFKNDPKRGVNQTDLYQMVSYAFKRGCTEIVLVYPNISEEKNPPDRFEIISGFPGHEQVNITAMEIPFWSFYDFKNLGEKMNYTIEKGFSFLL